MIDAPHPLSPPSPRPRRPSALAGTGGGAFAVESLESRLLMRVSWGAIPRLVGQDAAAAAFPKVSGAGTSVAVIDTGIDYNHPDLGGGFGRHHKVIAGWDFVDNDPNPMDPNGHGTAVAGVVAGDGFTYNRRRYQGVAPGANLIALRVDDGVNNPPPDRIRAALQWVLDHRAKYNIVAVNLSEGDGTFSDQKIVGQDYGDLLANLWDQGVLVACSSGNTGDSTGTEYPSSDANAVSVGSVNASDQVSDFSSTGSDLDLLAPGENVPVPWLAGGQPTYGAVSGTSFAAPWAAGAAALIHQIQPRATTDAVLADLQDGGRPIKDPASGQWFDRLDLYGALNLANAQNRRASRRAARPAEAATAPRVVPTAATPGPVVPAGVFDSPASPSISAISAPPGLPRGPFDFDALA